MVGGIVVLGELAAVAMVKFSPERTGVEIGARAPDYTAVDLATGDSVTLHQAGKGSGAIVNIWATWCAPCKEEMPAMQRTYGGGRIYQAGAFRGKRALLYLTKGGPEEAYRKGAFNGDISAILRPIHRGMLQFVGFDIQAPQIVYGPVRLTDEQRKQHLASYSKRLQEIAHESPIEVGIY